MTHTQKLKLIAGSIVGAITLIEIALLCHIVHAGLDTPFTLTTIITAVIIFNGSIWWFRHKYDSARVFYAKKDSEEKDDT